MKKIIFILTLLLFSCSKKEKIESAFQKTKFVTKELETNFRKIVIDYQKTYPVKKPRKGYIYIYVATFMKEKKDTTFIITRTSAGLLKDNKHTYGIYNDSELKNFIIYDELKLSLNQVIVYKKELPDSLIWKSKTFPESITPISKFIIKNKNPKFIKTDTIWNRWD
jgi:hypothetical protein